MTERPPIQMVPPEWAAPPPPHAPAPEWEPVPAPRGAGAVLADEVRHGPGRRWQFLPRSLSGRLVAGVVGLVVALVLATSICTYVALRSFLYNRLDQQVDSAAGGSATSVLRLFGNAPSTQVGLRSPQHVWAVALTTSGGVFAEPPSGGFVDQMQLNASVRGRLAHQDGGRLTLTTSDGQHLRVTTRQLNLVDPGQSTTSLTVVVGLSTSEVDHTLGRLVAAELVIGVVAILLAFGATTYGVRYSLRRLRSVTNTAQEVAAELSPSGRGLERRVEVDEPDTEVGQLAESMNTLLSAVETQFAARVASEERMRQFLADASHELRTPLTSIRGYAELSRMQGPAGAAEADNLARIESEGTRMSRLVDDLLTLARTDQGAERQHVPVDLSDAVAEAIDGVRAAYPSRRLDVVAEHALTVVGDRDQLVRVVRNLATNAAVHTRPDGPIRVSVSGEDGMAVIRVSDSGPGLPPDQAAHVFERFWRADKARSRGQGGSGLGMAIVAALVQAHGGDVRFDSSVESGSTVTVRLPRAGRAAPVSPSALPR